MSKKNQSRKSSASGAASNVSSPMTVETPTLVAAAPKTSIGQAFNPDYSDVIMDLKRIGILAGSFFVILIVLSFFIH